MLTFAWFVLICTLVLLCNICRTRPRNDGLNWFLVSPYLRISKKSRGRGDVNHAGLSRREQARR